MTTEIYLDANATCAVLPAAALAAAAAMQDGFGNPSSSHASGLRARAMLDGVRLRARRVLGAGDGQLIFTSGATEAIQAAVLSALCAIRERRARGEATGDLLLYGATEHKAVPESLAHWNRVLGCGLELRALPVDAGGRHRLDVLRELAPRAAMLCTMAANNETGVISDLAAIEALLAECSSSAYWMVDSVQALGKLALDLASTRIDYAPFSGHKLHAPKGVGMLYVRAGAPFTALMAGGGQEDGQRSGTENMAGIAALGAVLAALEDGATFRTHAEMVLFRARLAAALVRALPGVQFNAPFEHALPTTLNFSLSGLAGKELLDLFDAAGLRVSAGSACSAAKAAPSHVLEAMGLAPWRCAASVRMSFAPLADSAFIDAACERIALCGAALRASSLARADAGVPAVPTMPALDDGVVQLSAEGASCWLLFDRASAGCVVIDALAPLAPRIAALVRAQGCSVRAVLHTRPDPVLAAARAAVLAELGPGFDGDGDCAGGADALGWPKAHAQFQYVRLGDATEAMAIRLGANVLARLPGAGGALSYLLGAPDDTATLPAAAVRFAFMGSAALPGAGPALPAAQLRACVQRLAALVGPDTVLCGALEGAGLACSTPATESQQHGAAGSLLALQPRLARRATPAMDSLMHLDAAALARFLRTHPDALLVDVREAYEHAAGAGALAWAGRAVRSVPLSRLVQQLPGWLGGEQRPLVFFCRSGNRSARAARCLHRLGYQNAWHLAGGLALAGATAAA